jgi:hypothetical protein
MRQPHLCKGCCCVAVPELIEARRWSDFTERSFQAFCLRHPVPFIDQPKLRLTIMDLHRLFWQHMRMGA